MYLLFTLHLARFIRSFETNVLIVLNRVGDPLNRVVKFSLSSFFSSSVVE